MTGLLFAHPDWIAPLAGGLMAVGAALLWAGARGRSRMRTLLADGAVHAGAAHSLRDGAAFVALLLIAVALVGPRIGESTIQLSTSGIDLVILLDASRSMDASDTPPSRIDAARRAVQTILGGLGAGDQAALAAFSGRGVLLTPLTFDLAALAELVVAIDTSLVKPGGSDLGAGIRAALTAFDAGSSRPRAIFVLSDGETGGDHGGIDAARSNTRVFAVAFGSERGAAIPDHGAALRDTSGQVVTTRRRTAALASLADTARGRLFVADEWGHFEIELALRELRAPVARAPGEFVAQRVTVPMIVPFAAAAAALLWLLWLQGLPIAGAFRGRRAAATLVAVSTALLGAGQPSESPHESGRHAIREPISPEDLLRLGLAQAARRIWPEAERSFLAAAILARDPEHASIAYHNLGVAALERGAHAAARDAFFDALSQDAAPGGTSASGKRRGRDAIRQTQWNLEWTLAKLAASASEDAPLPRAERGGDRARQPEQTPAEKRGEAPQAGAAEPPNRQPDDDPMRTSESATPQHPSANASSGGARSEPRRNASPDMAPEERRGWLERIRDDPRRALLSGALEERSGNQRRGTPSW